MAVNMTHFFEEEGDSIDDDDIEDKENDYSFDNNDETVLTWRATRQ